MALPRRSANRYDLTKSGLFRLPTVKALAHLLEWKGTPSSLRSFSRRTDLFDEYELKDRRSGKIRKIQSPTADAKRLQERLNKLLKQIRVPDYLQSGVPGRSHLSNSREHLIAKGATVTVDITNFYPSISRRRVFRLFRTVFECPGDVADVITDLVCCNGHLATGSPASVLLSFFACRDMFDAIAERSIRIGAKFTLYVDDVAITGNTVGDGDITYLEGLFSRFGFMSKREKSRTFRKRSPKIVTGRAFRNGVSRAPNKKHEELGAALRDLRTAKPSVKRTRSAIGKLENMSLLDEVKAPHLKARATLLRTGLRSLRSNAAAKIDRRRRKKETSSRI